MAALEVDVAIVGGGSGGYAAARTAAARGLKTAVVESAERMGGLCILRGCMPTKALLHAAEVYHQMHRGPVWGLRAETLSYDFPRVMERKNRLIEEFASYRQQQLRDGRFQLLRAPARFLDPYTLDLGSLGTLRARAFVIATGSVMAPEPLPALGSAGCLSSDDALELERLPKSVIVLGGGAVAVEFAQFFRRFGVEVSVVQRSGRLLREFDPDATEVVESVFRKEGIEVYTGTRLLDAGRDGQKRFVEFEHQGQRKRLQAEAIFNGLGRSPNTSALNLAAAGVAHDRGRITTDGAMRTSAAHIFAAGDCTGPYELVHLAVIQGEIAGANVLSKAPVREMDYRLLTFVVFSDPQLATVGLTEEAARQQGRPYLAASYPFRDHGKSLIMEALDGHVKLLADPKSGEILGGACVGPGGGDLIHEIVVAMAARMTVHQLAAVPHYHPTLAEIWTYPAEDLASQVTG